MDQLSNLTFNVKVLKKINGHLEPELKVWIGLYTRGPDVMNVANIQLHKKVEKKFMYLPFYNGQAEQVIGNYMVGELKRYVQVQKKFPFLAMKLTFFKY